MGNIFYFILILELCVSVCISKDLNQATVRPQRDMITNSLRYEPDGCYSDRKFCEEMLDFNPKPICVFLKYRGLTNYFGICQIRLQYCLNKHEKKYNDGSASLDDEIYHNGKSFNCEYYQDHADTIEQMEIWYFKLGGLDAEKQAIYQAKKPTGNITAVP